MCMCVWGGGAGLRSHFASDMARDVKHGTPGQ